MLPFVFLDTPINPIKEFAQLCGRLLGPKYEYISGISSMMAVTGAVVVYWVLMSNFLRNTVDLIARKELLKAINFGQECVIGYSGTVLSII